MNKTQRKRLEKFADFLLTVPEEHFDLDSIVSGSVNDLLEIVKDMKVHDCKSTACAIGWLPAFTKNAPHNAPKFNWNEYYYRQLNYKNLSFDKNGSKSMDFWCAVSVYFGLSMYEMDTLFQPYMYDEARRTPYHVSRRIVDFLKLKDIRPRITRKESA